MRRLARAEAEERFTAFAEATEGLDRPVPYADWLTERQGHAGWNAELAEEYGKIPWVAAAAPFTGVQEVQETFCLDAPDPRRAYVEGRVRAAGVTEVLLADATWHTRLDVEDDDVWGVPSETWVAAFWRVLDAVPDDARLTIIDCHA
ncbi:hypothetical protein ACFHW2_07205 [Actinomadura sp. LOL_016]|uniref:hypothetical protein n=1 Tax=unclassified Actinomadura TaxID=2626254 RepID=UPI003A80EEFD